MGRVTAWLAGSLLVASGCGARSSLDESQPLARAGTAGTAGQSGAFTSLAGSPNASIGGATAAGAAPSSAGNAAAQAPLVARAISAGTDMTCAILSDSSVRCWGANDHGQLGDGTTTSSQLPVRVLGVGNATAVTVGGSWNTGGQGAASSSFGCALLADGTVKCWGNSPSHQFNDPTASYSPTPVAGLSNALAIAGGDWHACALVAGGSVRCWGDDYFGEWGNGFVAPCLAWECAEGIADPAVPVTADLTGAIAVAGQGSRFSCAVLSLGAVECWGQYVSGVVSSARPSLVGGVVTSAAGLAVGYTHACAVSLSGDVQCWGADSLTPVRVPGLTASVVSLSPGMLHGCALLADSTVQCWRWGETGSTSTDTTTPTRVPGIFDAIAVSAGYGHMCVLTRRGSVRCWGAEFGADPVTIGGF